MRTLTEKIIPDTTLAFTVLILISGIINLMAKGEERIVFIHFFFIILTFFALSCMEYLVLARIDFKTAAGYYLVSFGMWYLLMGICLSVTGWMGLSLKNILQYTAWTAAAYILLTRYNSYRLKREAAQINRLLEEMR